MKLNQLLVTAYAALLLSGCGTMAIVDKSSGAPGADESVLVFRVNPDKYKLLFFPGKVDQGQFRQDPFLGAVINSVATDGYLVARVKAGQTVGLMIAVDTQPDNFFTNSAVNFCGGTLIPVIEVPRAKVVYVTDILIARAERGLSLTYTSQLESAAAHIQSNYPNLGKDIQALPMQVIPTVSCNPNLIMLPIPVRR